MTDDSVVEVLDVGLVDGVTRIRGWSVKQEDGKVTTREQYQQHSILEVYMAALEPHIGDALAKVTVGAELAHSKDYGCKAQSFVSVSVTCNNSEDDITAVHNIIQPLARKLVNEDLEQMKEDRDAHLGQTSSPPRASAKPVAATPPGAPRPAFRR
jgi:hypothetical protein